MSVQPHDQQCREWKWKFAPPLCFLFLRVVVGFGTGSLKLETIVD